MGLETIGIALTIGSLALSGVTAFAGMQQANAAAVAQAEAVNDTAQAQYKEITRQQEEVNKTSTEQKSDRMRRADQELGTLRVIAGERGASGGTFLALAREIGGFEGMDLSRIERNRKANIDAGEAAKKATQQGAVSAINIASNQAQVQTFGSVTGFIGSGLQIGAGYVKEQAYLEALKNKEVP